MQVTVVEPPEPFLDRELVKKHLRVDHDDDDDLIDMYIAAACSHIDGPGTWLGRSIGLQTLQAAFDEFDGDLLRLDGQPLLTVASVIYDDADGIAQTIDSGLYTLDPAGVLLVAGETWPTPVDRRGAVRVLYAAGYDLVPAAITAGALLMVGDLYQNRETTALGSVNAIPMSTTVQALLNPYRVVSL